MPQLQDFTDNDQSDHMGPHTDNADKEKSEDGETLNDDKHDMETQVGSLARQLTRQLTRQSTRLTSKSTLENPFSLEDPDSPLNPNSPNFRVRDWMKMLLEIRSRDPEKYPERTAGIAFRNLSVHGFGSPTDYQKDVLNVLLEFSTIARRLIGRKMPKIQILRSFDGVVRSGEMLVVLGRPGSGCSTFLKTIAGEMNGISVSEDTVMNYQGEWGANRRSNYSIANAL
jgi:ABC-type glutathione transport system ATPase component